MTDELCYVCKRDLSGLIVRHKGQRAHFACVVKPVRDEPESKLQPAPRGENYEFAL